MPTDQIIEKRYTSLRDTVMAFFNVDKLEAAIIIADMGFQLARRKEAGVAA